MNAWTLPCAQAGCGQEASHVVVQTHGLALLFRSYAGTVCQKHARELGNYGGLALSLPDYSAAAGKEVIW